MNKRRLVLVDFYWTRDKDPRIPLGHASILSTIRALTDVDVRSVVMAVNAARLSPENVASQILEEAAGCADADVDIAFGAYVWAEELLQRVLFEIHKLGFGGRVILGGPQISYQKSGLEDIYPTADAFVRGYGEHALARMVAEPDARSIPGVHWAGTLDVAEQAQVDLRELPSPFLNGVIPLKNRPFIRWETQRGCQFQCSFCQHREAGARLRKTTLDPARIFNEIDLFCDHGVRDIAVLDPIFNMANHANDVLERFRKRKFEGRLSLQCRAELVDDEFIDLAATLNTRLEFGLQTIHKDEQRAIRRNNNMLRVDHAFREANSRGINYEVSLIFGLPEQTVESFEQSVAWCLERRVPVIKAFPLMLLRGTALDRDREQWKLKNSHDTMPVVIESTTFSHAEWQQMARLSEALKVTEGNHPRTLSELRRVAARREPTMQRWRPEAPEANARAKVELR